MGDSTPGETEPPEKNLTSQKTAETLFYTETNAKTYIVMIESTEQSENNIGKYNHLKMAEEIFDINFKDLVKVSNKGKNKLVVEFTHYEAANAFLENETVRSL
ncbi:hypothetical protein JTB14_027833 [Gonioctena quinquepunctata]|nr:hypothetical protein JTB14_027833 [Gonioctena quinquepunctata]